MKRTLSTLLALCLLLSLIGCTAPDRQFSTTYLDLFDTVTTIVGYAKNETEFRKTAQQLHDALLEYHKLFDIYHTYSGMNNLCTLNAADGEAVALDEKLLDFLCYGKSIYEKTGGAVNIAMGSVLMLWHERRTAAAEDPKNASLPDERALFSASEHTNIDDLHLTDTSAQLLDPALRLDVGAIGKGYAAQCVAEQFARQGLSGYILNLGGNVCTVGAAPNDSGWSVGVEDPSGADALLCRLQLQRGAVVTSGSYQRYYTVNGADYHHIIDPNTLYPAAYYRSVTIVAEDSALADALSTALFTMEQSAGARLIESLPGAEALWVLPDGTEVSSSGFSGYLISQ